MGAWIGLRTKYNYYRGFRWEWEDNGSVLSDDANAWAFKRSGRNGCGFLIKGYLYSDICDTKKIFICQSKNATHPRHPY